MPSVNSEFQKNDILDVVIQSLGYRGEGVARVGRFPVFINGALVGERVRALIILVKKDYAVGKLIEVLSPSDKRVTPPCKHFGKCGGCNLMHLAYDEQLKYKSMSVQEAFYKIARQNIDVNPCVPCDITEGYRNKLSLPVRVPVDGAKVGLFAYNSHRIIEIEDCPLQTESVRKTLTGLRTLASFYAPYNEENGKGILRHFVIRDLNGRLSLTVVATKDISKDLSRRVSDAGIKADELWLNINTAKGNTILGESTRLIDGRQSTYEFMNLCTYVHPKGFLQVNANIAEKLYKSVLDNAKKLNPRTIIDAYSGCGLLTALLARVAEQVIGIEIERVATESANELKSRSGINNVRNINGDCAEILPRLLSKSDGLSDFSPTDNNKGEVHTQNACSANEKILAKDTLIVLDPPRGGCDKAVINAVNESGAENIIYVSCNPSTLARDVALLTNYTVNSATPYDMFPHTCHVETLAVLSRNLNA